MEIGQARIGGFLVLRPVGRLDNFTAGSFSPVLAHAVSEGEGGIICDLAAVDYVSSAGLGALTTAAKAQGEPHRLAVVGLRPAVREVFAIARLQHVVAIFDTVEDAVAEWRRSETPTRRR